MSPSRVNIGPYGDARVAMSISRKGKNTTLLLAWASGSVPNQTENQCWRAGQCGPGFLTVERYSDRRRATARSFQNEARSEPAPARSNPGTTVFNRTRIAAAGNALLLPVRLDDQPSNTCHSRME